MRCSSWPSISRSVIICASSCRPIDSRSAVWALIVMAWSKSTTSRIDFSAFHTTQKMMASTFTGTVSRVSADSAVTSVTRTRWSTYWLIWSITGMMKNKPGPRRPT